MALRVETSGISLEQAIAKTRGIFTVWPPLVNFPSRKAQRSMLTTLALAFQISSQVSHLCHRKFTFGDEYVFVFFERLDALNAEDVFVFGLVGEKKPEGFEFQRVAEHLCQVAFGRS